ncbi:MAG: MFS transporter [Anaerolineales bacterium]|nr:MFS transporter [Anaerolineales bacterium]
MEKKGFLAQAAILSLYFISAGASVVNPALQGLAKTYSDVPFSTVLLVATLPTLMYIPFSIIAGVVAGSKIKYRTLSLVGAILWLVGGLAPLVFQDFTAILVARVVFGIGLGTVSPLGSALILRIFDGEKRANLLGLGSALMNGGGIVFMLLAGVLAAARVHAVWYVHLFGAIALVLVALWLPEPEQVIKAKSGERAPTPLGVWGYILLIFLITTLMYPMLLTMSTLIETGGFGTAAASGVVLSIFTGGGFLSSLVFGKLSKAVGRFSLPIALALFAVGMVMIAFGNSLTMIIIGATIAGFGSGISFPAVLMLMGKLAPPAVISGAMGLLMSFNKLAGFLSPYYMKALASISGNITVQFPLVVATVGFAILTVVFFVANLKPPAAAAPQKA